MKRYSLVLFSIALVLAFAQATSASSTSDLLGNSTIADSPVIRSF